MKSKEIEKYKNKVFKTIEKYRLLKNHDKIFVAVSGGKDSSAVLALLKEYIEENNLDCEIYAYHINLGFEYSDRLQKDVEKISEILSVRLFVTNLKNEFNFDVLKVSKITKRPICSVCGLIKRYLMNKIPRELGATKLATGHHAVDFIINYYKNIIHGNFDWNLKILPKLKSTHPKQLTKIRPLIFCFPEENKLYCEMKGIPITEISCPYSSKYCCYMKINEDFKIYEIIKRSEEILKDFNINFLRGIVKFNKKLSKIKELNEYSKIRECKVCGEPTNLEVCAFCRLRSYTDPIVLSTRQESYNKL